jgi:hypothetical protein
MRLATRSAPGPIRPVRLITAFVLLLSGVLHTGVAAQSACVRTSHPETVAVDAAIEAGDLRLVPHAGAPLDGSTTALPPAGAPPCAGAALAAPALAAPYTETKPATLLASHTTATLRFPSESLYRPPRLS